MSIIMPQFHVLTGNGKEFTRNIDEKTLNIGRSRDSHIVLPDHTVSRRHAQLFRAPEGLLLKDLGSHNGTYVNGSRITEKLLRPNDQVKIGASMLTFIDGSVRPAPEPKAVIEEPPDQKEEEVLKAAPLGDADSESELLASIKSIGTGERKDPEPSATPPAGDGSQISLLDLEKRNKVLYVLYQISRKLNTVPDFDELLNSIMDSIFQVIDADHGFVAMLGRKPDELIPKVIKYRTAPDQSANELRVSRNIINRVVNEKASVLSSNAMEDDRFGGAKSIFMQNIRSVMSVPLWRKDEVIGIIQLDNFRLSNKFTKGDLDLLTAISNQMAMVIEQANLNEKIRREEAARSRLERFHSPEVVDFIISQEANIDEGTLLAPTEKNATILFSDIVSFTPLSERLAPTDISTLLNQYFRWMTDIIFDFNGTLDKYIGDAIMAVFGAPIERENDAERAIMAALEMRKALFEMMADMGPDRRFDIRLGINTGRVVAGNLGSPKRMDYTVIGDTVNTAARLESIAENNQILIGENTYECVKGKFNIREIGKKSVKGKKTAVMVYEVLDQ
ncbi:MAG: FHA domain-containing protein [Deltaproteobacteria bacterium]|nr:FHA domain-containing protein [Deltaproteobacteria bacterium]